MKSIIILVVVGLTALAAATPPTDPDLAKKVDRSLKKKPALKSSSPTYALAVIGKEVTQQSWIIFDLERVKSKLTGCFYVDLNGDRDLTQPNEKILLPDVGSPIHQTKHMKLTDTDGKPSGYTLRITAAAWGQDETFIHYHIFVKTPTGEEFSASGDQNSKLLPANNRETAPVLHFDGPLQMGFKLQQPLSPNREKDWSLKASVGSYGLGDGSFISRLYLTIPGNVHPTASISWPAKKKGDPPLVNTFILKDRC